MRQIEINTFNQFLKVAGIRDEYTSQFTNSRIDKTDSIDSFMSSVKATDVFTDGFTPELVSDKEWQAAANLWKEYRDEHLPSEPAFKFCRCCWQLKPISSFNVHTQEKDGYSVYCRECVTPMIWMKNHPDENPKGCLTPYECILLSNHIFLNMETSRLIKEKGFKHCGLRHQDGRLFFIFCEKSTKKNLRFSKTGGVSIIDQSLIDDVIKSMNVNFTDPIHLRVTTNKSLKPSAVTIEVLQCMSHEDYLKNPIKSPNMKDNDNTESHLVTFNTEGEQPDTDDSSCTAGYKFCISCCTPKPISEFYIDSFNSSDGYNRSCRDCLRSKSVSTKNIFDTNTALFFGDKVFFAPEVSNMIKTSLVRSCSVMKNNKGCSLFFNRSYPGKNPNSSMFNWCDSSGITALKDEVEINKLKEALHLNEEHAYWLKLFIRKSSPDGPLVILIQGVKPYSFREGTETDKKDDSEETELTPNQGTLGTTNNKSRKISMSDFRLVDILKELEDPTIQDHAPDDIKKQAGTMILWLIGELKRVWKKQTQANTDLDKQDKSADNDPFKGVMRYLISNDPTQDLTAKFVKNHDNPDYEEDILALEETFANALKAVGWKLQRPVKVVHYEEF